MTTTLVDSVYVVRREDGRSCGHDHTDRVDGELCLYTSLEQSRKQGRRGDCYTLNCTTIGGDESVCRVMFS